jgi:deferrochelatase/peroxidase EfeB
MKGSRRDFLGSAGLGAAAGLAGAAGIARAQLAPSRPEIAPADSEPFYGPHQAGITTPMQDALYFASFDLTATKRQDVVGLLRAWTQAAARLTSGLPAAPMTPDANDPPADSGETMGLKPSRLTLTFGFGPDLFSRRGPLRHRGAPAGGPGRSAALRRRRISGRAMRRRVVHPGLRQ